MWAALATMILNLKGLPPFEILSFVFLISSVGCITLNKIKYRNQPKTKYPFYVWFFGIFGIFGNGAAFIIALQHAPAAHADLINYLWPLFLILLIPTLKSEKFAIKHLAAGIIAFAGIVFLITNGQIINGINPKFYYGYGWALISAICWTSYTFSCRVYGKPSPGIIYIFCICSLILSLGLHLSTEVFVMPSMFQFSILALMGLTSHSLAFYLWDYGVKKGNFKLLCVLSYGNPITSVLFLIAFGFSQPTPVLAIATLMVSGASFIYLVKWRSTLKKLLKIGKQDPELLRN